MTATYISNFLAEALLGWLAVMAISVVGYLLYLEIKEARRNRRMDAVRQRLGLRRA